MTDFNKKAPAEAGEDAIKAACVAWHQAKGENPFNVLYHGAWCGSFPHQTGPERWTFTVPAMKQAVEAYLRAQPPAPDALRVAVEALEKIKTGRASVTECSLIARQALAALPAEQKGGA